MFSLMLEMHARLPYVPPPFYQDFAEEEDFQQLLKDIDLHVIYSTYYFIMKLLLTFVILFSMEYRPFQET
jgi:hypothetical protein